MDTPKIQRYLWAICNKIRDVVNHIKFNFWEYYSIYDVKNTGYVADFIFKNVLAGPLKSTINLNDEEIQLLIKYFEEPNGQVHYGKFCQMIHNDETNLNEELSTIKNENFNYTTEDSPRLNVMKKLASFLNSLKISLESHFENFEEPMDVKQFKNILYALKIHLRPLEIQLITDKFATNNIIDKKLLLDELYWVNTNDPQSIFKDINIKESDNVSRIYSNKNVFHPMITNKMQKRDNVIAMLRIFQRYVFENRINIGQFFEQFDPFRKGYVSEKQFRRCLDVIGISSLHGLYYSEPEIASLLLMYKDKDYPERINWKKFEDEINNVFVEKKKEKSSDVEVTCSRNVNEMLRIRGQDWEAVELSLRNLFTETVIKIKDYLGYRRILLDQYFKVFDKNNHGHISMSSFRRGMFTAGIKCSEDELSILEKRFVNVDGFNYLKFVKMLVDIDDSIKKCSLRKRSSTNIDDKENCFKQKKEISSTTLSKLMTKIKIMVKRRQIKIDQFFNQFDFLNHKVLTKDNFQRGLDMAGIDINKNEREILLNKFESETHPGQVDYIQFCNMVEEAFVTLGLEKTPSTYPQEFLATYEIKK